MINKEYCDRCEVEILDDDAAICFNSGDEQVYLCEPCIEEIKREWMSENRNTNFSESD